MFERWIDSAAECRAGTCPCISGVCRIAFFPWVINGSCRTVHVLTVARLGEVFKQVKNPELILATMV